MIVIEGSDNCGKTTLSEHLAKVLGLTVVHSEKPETPLMGQHRLDWMADNPLSIYDRASCISEAVYGPLLRGGSVYGEDHWKILAKFLMSQPLIIYCKCSEEKALSYNGRDDMDGVQANGSALYHKYDEVMDKVDRISSIFGGEVIHYDYEVHSLEVIENFCRVYINNVVQSLKLLESIGES